MYSSVEEIVETMGADDFVKGTIRADILGDWKAGEEQMQLSLCIEPEGLVKIFMGGDNLLRYEEAYARAIRLIEQQKERIKR